MLEFSRLNQPAFFFLADIRDQGTQTRSESLVVFEVGGEDISCLRLHFMSHSSASLMSVVFVLYYALQA